jgi:hypothetical protein
MSLESSPVGSVQVVEPGSADDPFTVKQDQPTTRPDNVQSQPVTEETPESSDLEWTEEDDAKLLAELEEQVQARVAAAHSGLDKRVAQFEKQVMSLSEELAAAQKAVKDAERRAAAANLSEDQLAVLKAQWEAEDLEGSLKMKEKALDDYLRNVTAYDLVTRYEKYGLTAEQLEEAESVDEMHLIAERVRADFLESGGKPAPKGPAGAKAPTDLGGRAPGAEPFKLGTEQGVKSLADNVRNLFKQPGNIL